MVLAKSERRTDLLSHIALHLDFFLDSETPYNQPVRLKHN